MLFPIECKRLPTPKSKNRDEREYVISGHGTTGGIQRFKYGFHGAAHTFAAMIAFVQEQSCSYWLDRVNDWIQDLNKTPDSIWSQSDLLKPLSDNRILGICTFGSRHRREKSLADCELRHLWIEIQP